jgi:outer membrane protein TolC
LASGVSAQEAKPVETVRLTLEEAVRRAIEHNPDLAIVRLATDVQAARVGEAQGAFKPLWSATFGRSSTATPPSNSLLGSQAIDTSELFSSTGARQRLQRGGGTWSVSWDASRIATSNPFSSFEPSLQSGVLVAFSQPLFRDRKMDSARQQFIVTTRNQESSELRLRESVVQTVAAVKHAYWTLKAAMANVTVQQRSLELAQDLVRQNRARVEVGQAPPLDLVQAEAEVAQRRENLIRAETAARDIEDRLRRLIMDPADTGFWRLRLAPVEEPTSASAPPDADAAVARALDGRYDLARARQDLSNADTNVQFLGNQTLPDVRLEASYRGGGAGGTELVRTGPFPGVVTGRLNTGFGDVLGQQFRHDFATWSVGVTMSYPIGRSTEKAGLARAEIERKQAAHAIASLQLRIAETIRQAARQVQSTAERIDAARAGETLAAQRFAVESRRFEAGLSTTFLVTQAQRDLLQAQVSLLQATLDHQSSLVDFEAVQLAPIVDGESVAINGSSIVVQPPPAPKGVFRQGGG